MSEEVTASLADTAPPAAEPAAPAVEAAPAPVDNSKIFSKGYNEGIDKGAERARQEILNTLGVASIDEIQLAKPEAVSSVKAQNEEQARIIAEQKAQLENMTQAQQAQALQSSIQTSFDALKLQPKKSSTVMSEINSSFDFQTKDGQTRVFQKGSDTPILDGQGNFASVQQAVEKFAKDPGNTWLFNTTVNGHIDNSVAGSNDLPKDFLKHKENVDAVNATGQMGKLLSGVPIDMVAVNAYKKSGRKDGPLTLIR